MKAFYIVLIAFAMSACDERFTRDGWMEKDSKQLYTRRDRMVYDLVHNYKLKNLPSNELKNLLGEPDRMIPGDTPEFHYPLAGEYQGNSTIQTKVLVIRLNPDSTVNSFRIDKLE